MSVTKISSKYFNRKTDKYYDIRDDRVTISTLSRELVALDKSDIEEIYKLMFNK